MEESRERLIRQLEELPDSLLAKERLIIAKNDEIAAVEAQLSSIEREVRASVQAATKEDGKPLFTNERAREDELRRRLQHHEEHLQLSDSLRALRSSLFELKAELRYLEARFKSARSIALLLGGGME